MYRASCARLGSGCRPIVGKSLPITNPGGPGRSLQAVHTLYYASGGAAWACIRPCWKSARYTDQSASSFRRRSKQNQAGSAQRRRLESMRFACAGRDWRHFQTAGLRMDTKALCVDTSELRPGTNALCMDTSESCMGAETLCVDTSGSCMGAKTLCMATSGSCMGAKTPCVDTSEPCMGAKTLCVATSDSCMGAEMLCMATWELRVDASGFPAGDQC
jgi:hypothetical protein